MAGAGSQEAPPAPAGARFVNVPSQGPALAFDTVRAQPRAPDATREPETFQTVDPRDLEEMLAVAFRKSLDVIKAVEHPAPTCAEPWRDPNVTMVLTQIKAEAEARTPDIKATTTLVSALCGVGTNAFCDAVSTDERRLSARRSGTGSVDVHEQAGGAETPVTAQVEAARRGAVTTAVQGFRAWDQYREDYRLEPKPREMFRARIGVPCHGKLLGVDTSGSWVPSQRAVVYDAAGPMESILLSTASDGEVPMSPEILAALVVGALRQPGAFRRLCQTSLVAPRPGTWAAAHPDGAWDAAGRVPAVRVNVLLWSGGHGHYMRCIFLSTCDGAEWRVAGVRDGLIVLEAQDLGVGPSASLAGPFAGPSAAPQADGLQAAASARGFVCRPSDDVCLSFTAVRSTPRPRDAKPKIETFLNMDMDDVEAAVEVALEQVEDIMRRKTTLYPSGEPCEVSGVLVQVEAEALSLSRDFRVTATLVDDLGPGTSLFCKAMSTAERRVFAEKNEDGAWRVYATRTVDGVESAPIDCTEEVERARRFAKHTVDQALAAHRCAAACKDPSCGYMFRTEIVARGMFVAAKEDRSDKQPCTKVKVQAEWHKEHPAIITTSRSPLEPSADNIVFIGCEGPPGQTCITVRPFRADDVLKQLCKDALMAPLSYGCAAAHPKRAWNKRGEFPAVKVNVLVHRNQDGPSHKVFLSLPEGKEWRLKPLLGLLGSATGRCLAMHDASDNAGEPAPSLTWQDFFAMHGCNDGVDLSMGQRTSAGDASASTSSSAETCAFCAPKPRALCDPAAPPQGARFVCVPSDAVSLSFDTVRAQPRPEDAQPSHETLLNVPMEDLEELLRVALTFSRAIEKSDCEQSWVLTRIGPESLTGHSDIRATSTLVFPYDENVDFFCRAISGGGRHIRALEGGDGEWGVFATLDVEDNVLGPLNCTTTIKHERFDAIDTAMKTFGEITSDSRAKVPWKGAHAATAFRFRTRGIAHAGTEFDLMTRGDVLPERANTLLLETLPLRKGTNTLDGTKVSALSCPDVCAKNIVAVLRKTGALETLAARIPASKAAGAGGSPAVTVNVLQIFVGEDDTTLVWLSLPEGARWTFLPAQSASSSPPKSKPTIAPLGVDVYDRKAFDAGPEFFGPRWQTFLDQYAEDKIRMRDMTGHAGADLNELTARYSTIVLRFTEKALAERGPTVSPALEKELEVKLEALGREARERGHCVSASDAACAPQAPSDNSLSSIKRVFAERLGFAASTTPESGEPGSPVQPRAPPAPAVSGGQRQGGSKKKKNKKLNQRQRAKLQANRGDKE